MKGSDLKLWRESNNMTQDDLVKELGVKSRQTIASWEKQAYIPRIVELAVVALDQIEAIRRRSGLKTQFRSDKIGGLLLEKLKEFQLELSNNANK